MTLTKPEVTLTILTTPKSTIGNEVMLVILASLLDALVSFSTLKTLTTLVILPAETTSATIVKVAEDWLAKSPITQVEPS